MAADAADAGPSHVFSIAIRAPIGRVWEEIARTGPPAQPFYWKTVFDADLRPGGALRYVTEDGKRTFIRGEILEVEPPRRLVHTFRFTHMKEPPTRVTWELAEEAGVTRVTVRHDRFEGDNRTYRSTRGGWPFILDNLRSWMEAGRLPFGTRVKYGLIGLMMPLMPKPE